MHMLAPMLQSLAPKKVVPTKYELRILAETMRTPNVVQLNLLEKKIVRISACHAPWKTRIFAQICMYFFTL